MFVEKLRKIWVVGIFFIFPVMMTGGYNNSAQEGKVNYQQQKYNSELGKGVGKSYGSNNYNTKAYSSGGRYKHGGVGASNSSRNRNRYNPGLSKAGEYNKNSEYGAKAYNSSSGNKYNPGLKINSKNNRYGKDLELGTTKVRNNNKHKQEWQRPWGN